MFLSYSRSIKRYLVLAELLKKDWGGVFCSGLIYCWQESWPCDWKPMSRLLVRILISLPGSCAGFQLTAAFKSQGSRVRLNKCFNNQFLWSQDYIKHVKLYKTCFCQDPNVQNRDGWLFIYKASHPKIQESLTVNLMKTRPGHISAPENKKEYLALKNAAF